MADVVERGQLILVAALSLAILFVALALILNTAIYTENLATRSSDIGGGTDAVRYHDAARDGIGGLIEYVNAHNNTTHATLQANLSTGVAAFSGNSSRLFAAGDRAVETELLVTVDGTRIAQSDAARNFSSKSGTANWTLVEGVDHTREVRIHVYSDLLVSLLTNDPFTIVFDGPTSDWTIQVIENTGNVEIEVTGPSGSDTCTSNVSDGWINVTDGEFAGSRCAVLDTFADGIGSGYDIRVENGDNARGTYTMTVDNSSLADAPSPQLWEDKAGQPFAAHAVYSANITVIYQTPRLFYNATVRVAPGEIDG